LQPGRVMTAFYYTAVDAKGNTATGSVDADSEDAAARLLFQQGAVPLSITAAQPRQAIRIARGSSALHHRDLIDVLSYLAMLMAAGMNAYQALSAASSLVRKQRVKDFLGRVQDGVTNGAPLSTAFQEASSSIDRFVIETLKAGELSGQLTATLESLESHLRRFQAFRAEIVSALIYPAILFVMAVLSLALLFLVVIPEFKPLFENSTQSLPSITAFVLSVSDALQRYGLTLAALTFCVFMAGTFYLRSKPGELAWRHFILRAPWGIGAVVTRVEIGAMARLLALLLKNGVPMMSAFLSTASAMRNVAFRHSLEQAAAQVREGVKLSSALENTGVFPPVFLDLLRVGEDASNLDWALTRLAGLCEADVERTLKRLTAAFVPVVTIIMGALIAGVIGSVLLALLSANQLAIS